MKDNGEDNVIEMIPPKSSIREILNATADPSPDAEPGPGPDAFIRDEIVPLPQPGDPYDTANARAANKPVPMLRFVMGDSIRGFPYANLDVIDWLAAQEPGVSPSIVIWFTGLKPVEVILSGRNLLLLYDRLSYHRIAWVRELPRGRDFKELHKTVITGIAITPLK